MICFSLYSGSSGNAVFVKEKDTAVLIDAGGSFRRLKAALEAIGETPERLSAILVTHEHTDHTGALGQAAQKLRIPVFCLQKVAKEIYLATLRKGKNEEAAALARCIKTVEPGRLYGVGDLDFTPFSTPHDSEDSCGFLLGDKTVGVATDLGAVTDGVREALTGCENVILEANHDLDMLYNGPYPPYLKERVASETGHLNNVDCGRFAAELCRAGCRNLMLFHLSAENNLPGLARDTVLAALEQAGVDPGSVRLVVADRTEVTRFL